MQNDLIRRGNLYEKLKWIPIDGEERDTILRIINMVLEAPAVDAVPVVRCLDCNYRGCSVLCPMCYDEYDGVDYHTVDNAVSDGFCHCGSALIVEGDKP